jgi:hypothetical protein
VSEEEEEEEEEEEHNNLEHIRKQQICVRNVIIESAPRENKMAGKGQLTSERARK